MFSSHWPSCVVFMLKALTLAVGLSAAGAGWRAAFLWLKASKVQIMDTTPHTAVSYDDSPALGILGVEVSGFATQTAYSASSALNARAARWTAWAAILTGVTTILGAL